MYYFTLEPSRTAIMIVIIITAVIIFIVSIVLLPIFFLRIGVNENQIIVSAPLFPGIKVSKKDVVSITVVNLKEHEELKPSVRTFGIGLPGYLVGWFRLNNGSKAYLAIGKGSEDVVVIKLSDGSFVILAPKDISKFTSVLKTLGWLK